MAAKIGTLNSETGRALKQMALITVDKAHQSHVVEMIWAKKSSILNHFKVKPPL